MITPSEIRLVVSQPSKLGPGRDADEYLMERYRRVAIEQEAAIMAGMNEPCPPTNKPCTRDTSGIVDCRACWREALEREGK